MTSSDLHYCHRELSLNSPNQKADESAATFSMLRKFSRDLVTQVHASQFEPPYIDFRKTFIGVQSKTMIREPFPYPLWRFETSRKLHRQFDFQLFLALGLILICQVL